MSKGPQLRDLKLTSQEANQLLEWTRRPKTSQALALRARIILACAEGHNNSEVARNCRVIRQTVGKWRSRFLAHRLDGLLDEPRPGAPRKLDDARIEQLIAATLNERPREATHWSTRLMANKLRVSQSTVSRVWRAFGLAAAPGRDLQALGRSFVHREGARHRRAVPQSADQGDGVVRR
jgi:transposase